MQSAALLPHEAGGVQTIPRLKPESRSRILNKALRIPGLFPACFLAGSQSCLRPWRQL